MNFKLNQTGISVLEVLISLALLLVTSFALMHRRRTEFRVGKHSDLHDDLTTVRRTLREQVDCVDTTSCAGSGVTPVPTTVKSLDGAVLVATPSSHIGEWDVRASCVSGRLVFEAARIATTGVSPTFLSDPLQKRGTKLAPTTLGWQEIFSETEPLCGLNGPPPGIIAPDCGSRGPTSQPTPTSSAVVTSTPSDCRVDGDLLLNGSPSDATITSDQSLTVKWWSRNATTCNVSGVPAPAGNELAYVFTVSGPVYKSPVTYHLHCTGKSGPPLDVFRTVYRNCFGAGGPARIAYVLDSYAEMNWCKNQIATDDPSDPNCAKDATAHLFGCNDTPHGSLAGGGWCKCLKGSLGGMPWPPTY